MTTISFYALPGCPYLEQQPALRQSILTVSGMPEGERITGVFINSLVPSRIGHVTDTQVYVFPMVPLEGARVVVQMSASLETVKEAPTEPMQPLQHQPRHYPSQGRQTAPRNDGYGLQPPFNPFRSRP